MNEELCQEHSALLPLKREEGENIGKKNMSFSKWARGGGEGNNVAFSCWFIRVPFPWSTSALGRNSFTFNTVALYHFAFFLWSKNIAVKNMQQRFVLCGCLFPHLLCCFPGSIANLSIVVWFAMEQWTLLFLAKSSSVKWYVIQINRASTAVQKGQCFSINNFERECGLVVKGLQWVLRVLISWILILPKPLGF